MGRIGGGFIVSGYILHTLTADFQGILSNMLNTNDKLSMAQYVSESNYPSQSGSTSQTNHGQEVYLEANELIISILLGFYTADTKTFTVRFRSAYAGSDIGGNTSQSLAAGWRTLRHILSPAYVIPTTGKYYGRIDAISNFDQWKGADVYRGTTYCAIHNGTRYTAEDGYFDVYCLYRSGSYQSQSLYVGTGTIWGKITWDEVLDGAIIVAKVRASMDQITWTEWQTLANGDIIAVKGDYLQYRFEISSAGNNTILDNVKIEYML